MWKNDALTVTGDVVVKVKDTWGENTYSRYILTTVSNTEIGLTCLYHTESTVSMYIFDKSQYDWDAVKKFCKNFNTKYWNYKEYPDLPFGAVNVFVHGEDGVELSYVML